MTRKSFQRGYIFKRQTTRGVAYVIRYRIRTADGSWRHKAETVYTPRRKDAAARMDERLREVNQGARLPAEITFKQFAENQWEAYTKARLKPSTQATHRSNVTARLLPALGGLQLAEVTPSHVGEVLAKLRNEGRSPKTQLNLYLLLQKMFNHALDLDLIPHTPVRRSLRPRVERAEKPTLTPAQVRAVIDAVPERYRALFFLLSLTGVRIGEALGLKWQDVDFDGMKLHIRRSVWRGKEQSPKTQRSIRAKPLTDVLAAALLRHRQLSLYTEPDCYVFTNGAGRPLEPDNLRKRVLYPAMKKAKINLVTGAYGFHIFRHSAGSVLHQATGGDLKQTQNFLGHSSVATTGDVYTHLQTDAEAEAVRKLEQAFFPELCSIVLKPGETVTAGRLQ